MLIPSLRALYYHRDFDGVVSAAMLLSCVETIERLHAVDYHLKERWASMHLDKSAAIVDFLFHPDALLWIDHHVDPFVRPEWKRTALERETSVWDVDAPSCPPIIDRIMQRSPDWHAHFASYVHWSSIIDSGRYESPQSATDLGNPYLLLSRVISSPANQASLLPTIVGAIAFDSIESVLAKPEIQASAEKELDFEHYMREEIFRLVSFDGLVAFLDQSLFKWPYQRYHPYLIYPDAAYVVGIYPSEPAFTVSVGANPWRPEPRLHVGSFCRQWGGGGRKNVGGVSVRKRTRAQMIAGEMIKSLNVLTSESDKPESLDSVA